jgi:thioredoxin reductase (NADPH)
MADYDIIVIGGGIAGMSAALTAARAGRRTVILTGGVPGGELLNVEKVAGLPGHEDGIAGYDLCPITQELADAAGAEFVTEQATDITPAGEGWSVTSEGGEYTARSVILAMGAHPAKLGVPGEEQFTGKGVSHCATCDGPLLRGKVAVVAGGGDSGMQEALTLAAHVAKVVIVERNAGLTGQAAYVAEVESNPKIEVLAGREVAAIEGADKVEAVRLRDAATGEETALKAQGLFAFTGLVPNIALAEKLVELDSEGRIRVDASLRTSARGIFAAGNVRGGNGWRAAAAMGDGASAAHAATRYCADGDWPA